MTETFLFIRTKNGVSQEATLRELETFRLLFDSRNGFMPDFCVFMDVKRIFSDGFIARFEVNDEDNFNISNICAELDDVSRAWTLFQPKGMLIEKPVDGPLKEFMWVAKGKPITQIYLMGASLGHGFMSHVDKIRAKLTKSATYVAFSYSDGAVVVSATDEPISITCNRCERELNVFDDWLITSSDDDAYEYVKFDDNEYWI